MKKIIFILMISSSMLSILLGAAKEKVKEIVEVETVIESKKVQLSQIELKLEEARKFFGQAVENKQLIHSTRNLYMDIRRKYPKYKGRCDAYLGALLGLEAKFNKDLKSKVQLAKVGLEKIEKGIEYSPNDLEALYIHGYTCQKLPAFFNKAETARASFDKIFSLLKERKKHHSNPALKKIIEHMLANVKWDAPKEKVLRDFLTNL